MHSWLVRTLRTKKPKTRFYFPEINIKLQYTYYTPSVIYCPKVFRDIILLALKDVHVMYSGVADKIQPYRIEIVVACAKLKTAYSYI